MDRARRAAYKFSTLDSSRLSCHWACLCAYFVVKQPIYLVRLCKVYVKERI